MGSENNPELSPEGAGLNFFAGLEEAVEEEERPDGLADLLGASSPSGGPEEWRREDLEEGLDPRAIKSTP